MSLAKAFEEFIELLHIQNEEDILYRFSRITQKLNEKFWRKSNDKVSNGLIVGSLGRDTAINGVSDLDMIFELPWEIYRQYDAYEGNGQSALLQCVKDAIKETYPNTEVRGDGQVVVVTFSTTNDVIEVCPAFRNNDNSFKYPDSNDGGKWKKTDPIPEIDESESINDASDGVFCDICFLSRAWKNNVGFKMSGLLIDTLAYNFLNESEVYKEAEYSDYFEMIKDYFEYLMDQDSEQSYWYALGSNQKVYNKDNGKFVKKAKKVFDKLDSLTEDSEELYDKLIEIFGSDFPDKSEENVKKSQKSISENAFSAMVPGEMFIEQMFPVDIRYELSIDCQVVPKSYGRKYLLSSGQYISTHSDLYFYIVHNEVRTPYRILWKVRNRGIVAKRKDSFRGEIVNDDGNEKLHETADFEGPHYVECYIVKNGVCVARDRIDVNILKFAS